MSVRNVFGARSLLAVASAVLLGAASACGTGPTEPEVTTATVRFESGIALSACVRSTITLTIDGARVGSMAAGQSQSFTVSPGSHSLRASALEGSWGPREASVLAGHTLAWTLTC